MNPKAKKTALFILRWGIAIAGIWWVVANMSLRDKVMVLDDHNIPHSAVLTAPASEDDLTFHVINPRTGLPDTVAASRVINAPDREQVVAEVNGKTQKVKLLGLNLEGDISHSPRVTALLIEAPAGKVATWISPSRAPDYQLHVPHARVHIGLLTMVRHANPVLLWLALVVFPMTFILTSYRWGKLMDALDIHLLFSRTFVLNMVGAFYNTFMPGSTGGDLLKAYYASKQTPHRVHAVMSVLVDRVIGLIALVILGGVMAAGMAAWIHLNHGPANDPVARICTRVAALSVVMMVGLLLGLMIVFHPKLRSRLGIDFILERLPMQKHVRDVVEVMECYRRRPMTVLWAIIVSFPVHLTTIVVAILAGRAFDLPLSNGYYFVAVPVIVLVGAIPISPQGAGVMEYFAVKLTERQGATVGQAFALTMSIRVVQILWNLSGGILVLRGGYHAPDQREQKEMEQETSVLTPEY
jgi:uncharacterized protein (TIRG00374 family)